MFAFANKDGGMVCLEDDTKKEKIQFELDIGKKKKKKLEI